MAKEVINRIVNRIITALQEKSFIIQRYDAYSSDSVYLKLDYGVCNSIRISDHEGKKHLQYRYNVIIGGENNIVEEEYVRYYFDENHVDNLLNQILFDRLAKITKYSISGYKNLMKKNMLKNQGTKGFWSNARVVDDVMPVKTQSNIPKLTKMPDGTYALGPDVALQTLNNVILNQMQLDSTAKFKKDEQVQVTASFEDLTAYYATDMPLNEAKAEALKIVGRPGFNVGTVIGPTKCDEGMFYTLELPLMPMAFLPENFIGTV